jgi:hypothetical protein
MRFVPGLRNDKQAPDSDARVVTQLIRYGRRPLVHVVALHANEQSRVRAYVTMNIVPRFKAAGMDVVVQYMTREAPRLLVSGDIADLVRESHGDFFAVVDTFHCKRGTLTAKCNGRLEQRTVQTFVHTIWKCWPQNPHVTTDRLAALTDKQVRALLTHYCPGMEAAAAPAAAGECRQALDARVQRPLQLENTMGQERPMSYDPLTDGSIAPAVKATLLEYLESMPAAAASAAPTPEPAPALRLTRRAFPSLDAGPRPLLSDTPLSPPSAAAGTVATVWMPVCTQKAIAPPLVFRFRIPSPTEQWHTASTRLYQLF